MAADTIVSANGMAMILARRKPNAYAQVNANIRVFGNINPAQANASVVKYDHVSWHGQAQAKMFAYDYPRHAQAQAKIS